MKTITLLDTETGDKVMFQDNLGDPYDWVEGNYSCDCNRQLRFGNDDSERGCCLGCHRYLVVAKTGFDCTLEAMNDGYPKELLKKHGIL